MTCVDFHVLAEGSPSARSLCACRLAERAFEQGLRTYILTTDAGQARQLDDLLWTFNDRAFLPHEIYVGDAVSHERVLIVLGDTPGPASHRDLLINLTDQLPSDYEQYARVAEIVDIDPERKRTARERYKLYRERGCTLETHNLQEAISD